MAELLGTTPTPAAAESPESPEAKEAASVKAAEAELAGEVGEEPGEAGKTEEQKATSPDALQQLIDSKYGGDRAKFIEGLHEQWQSSAKLHKEIESLRQQLSTPAPVEEPIEHPDIPWLSQEIAALDAEANTNKATQTQLITQGNTKQAEILQLKGEMRRADDMDKEALQAKIDRAEAALDRLAERWKDLDHRNRRIEHEKRDFNRQKQLAEREVAAYRAEQVQLERDDQAYQAGERKIFNEAVDLSAAEYQLAAGPQREHMREVIRAEASLHLRSLPEGSPAIDLAAFVKARADVYANMMKLSKKTEFQQLTKDKLATTRPPVSKPGNSGPPNPQAAPKVWTADYVRRRAAKLLG